MNTAPHFEKLDALWAEIERLQAVIVECERESLSLVGTEAEIDARVARQIAARAELDRLRTEHGILAHFLLTSVRQRAA